MRQYIKQIGADSTIYTIANLLTKAFGIILIPIYSRYLSQGEYGIISLLTPFVGLLAIIYDFGMGKAWQRFFFDHQDKSIKQKEAFGNIIIFILVIGLVLNTMLSLAGEALFKNIFPNIDFYPYIFLSIWSAYFLVLFELKLTLYKIRKQSKKYGLYSLIKFSAIIIFTIIAVVSLKMGALGKIASEFIVMLIFFIISFILLFKDIIISINFKVLKPILLYAITIIPHALAGVIANFSGRFFINLNEGLESTAIFNIGFLIASIMNIFVVSIHNSWIPFFNKLLKDKKDDAKPIISQLTTYYVITILFVCLGLIVFSKEAILILSTTDYLEANKIIPILAISYIFMGFYFMMVQKILFIKTAVKKLPLITTFSASINIILNYILIPKFGIIGSAYSTLIYMMLMFVLTFFYSQKILFIKYEFKRISISILLFSLWIMLFFSLSYLSLTFFLEILLKIFLLFSFLMVLFISGFFRESEISNLKDVLSKLKKKYLDKV